MICAWNHCLLGQEDGYSFRRNIAWQLTALSVGRELTDRDISCPKALLVTACFSRLSVLTAAICDEVEFENSHVTALISDGDGHKHWFTDFRPQSTGSIYKYWEDL